MLSILREPHSLVDAFRLLKKAFKYKRLRNILYVYRSFKKSNEDQCKMKGSPIAVSFEPTTSCNLRCPQCPSGLRSFSRNTGMLDTELFNSFIQNNYREILYLLLYFQGEPYLHPEFFELIKLASEKNLYTATSTNAHYLDKENAHKTVESGLDRIIISIDGLDQESFAKYRVGGKLEKVIEGTKNLVQAKRSQGKRYPFIIWQFIIFKHNENQIEEIKKLGTQLGVNQVAIKTAQVYDQKGAEELLPSNPKYNRYKNNSLQLKSPIKNECWKMWHSCVITWDGNVVPCCFDKDAAYVLGNISQNHLKEIWLGNKYKAFRQTLWKGRKNIPICTNCSEGAKIWEF
jgi:radical SAM protein with 4Fe4S-binding SPASM domain